MIPPLQRLSSFWNDFIEINQHFSAFVPEKHPQFLSALFLLGSGIGGAAFLVELLAFRQDFQPGMLAARMLGMLVPLALYLLNRFLTLSMEYQFYIVTAVIFLIGIVLLPGSIALYYLFTLVFALFCIMHRVYKTVMLASIHLVGMSLIPLFVPEVNPRVLYNGPILFYIAFSILIISGVYYFKRLVMQYQKRLLESEARYRVVSSMVSDYAFFIRFQPDGTLLNEWMTDAVKSVTGYSATEMNPLRAVRHFHEDDVERVRADVARVRAGEANSGEYRIKTRDNEIRWVHVSRLPVWNEAKTAVEGFYGAVKDITEAKLNEEDRLKMALEKQRFHVGVQFARSFSHYFRNMLSAVESSRYLAHRSNEVQRVDKVEEHLDNILHTVLQMRDQLDNLDTLYRLMEVSHVQADPVSVLELVISRNAEGVERKGIAIRSALADALPNVPVHPEHLRQALHHLLINAIQHTPQGGEVVVTAHTESSRLTITVQDSGQGIAPEDLPFVFDVLYRADEARGVDQGGIGLGLSIAKMVAENAGGSLTVASAAGTGCLFTLTLPTLPQTVPQTP